MTAARRLVSLLVLLLALSAPAQAAEVLEAILDNGLKVLLLEDHRSPVATFQIWYRVGSRNERPGLTGLSHLLEHMMFKGTARFGPGVFATTIEQLGGQDNAFTSQDYTAYFVNLAADRLDVVLELEADRVQHLLLDPKAFEAERRVVLEERRTRTEDDPVSAMAEELGAIAFRLHPYGLPIIGYKEDIERLTVEDLRAWYRAYYAPSNALVVAVGDFNAAELLEKIRKAFGAIPRGPDPPPVRVVEPGQDGERRVVVKKQEARLAFVFMGYLTPNHASPDSFALDVLATILAAGRSSRLYQGLVYEQRLALDAGGDYSFLASDPDLFTFYASVLPGKTVEEVERALLAEVERLKTEPVTDEELARAKNQIDAGFVFRQDSVFRRAMTLARFELAGDWRLMDRYLPGIRAVTPADLLRVARTYFDPDRRNTGILLPLASHGPAVPDR
ncbi:MAG: insulinase family protein [Candidatus Rokubacteria bacterium]|nr:insulinase family protein [Candidatus Rokubacteria bacterium]